MQKLIGYIMTAVTVLFGMKAANTALKKQVDDLTEQVKTQSDTIATLQQQVADDELDDAALQKAAEDAKAAADAATARADELQRQIDEANAAGDELAKALTDDPQTPSVDSNFNVTAQPGQ